MVPAETARVKAHVWSGAFEREQGADAEAIWLMAWGEELIDRLRCRAAADGAPCDPRLEGQFPVDEMHFSIGDPHQPDVSPYEQKFPMAVLVVFLPDGQVSTAIGARAVANYLAITPNEHGVPECSADPAIAGCPFMGYVILNWPEQILVLAHTAIPHDTDGLPDLRTLLVPPAQWPQLTPQRMPRPMREAGTVAPVLILPSSPPLNHPASLTGPRIRSRKMLSPLPMQTLFDACGTDKEKAGFAPVIDGENGFLRYAKGASYVQIQHPNPVPLDLRNANAEKEALEAWARAGVRKDLERLDDMAWDVAALAVTSFYARTKGNTIDTRFPLMTDDYMDWRGVDPRKRSEEGRQAIIERMKLLCSDRFEVYSETTLHITDPTTGRRKKQNFIAKGPLLVRAGDLYRRSEGLLQMESSERPDGVLLSLGEWARKFVEEKAMLGTYMKRLAEYDLRRQLWERRIGWYLSFQMQNQASKAGWAKAAKKGDARMLAPQHSLKMRTVLEGARLDYGPMAETNPGKVVQQWADTLKTLKEDRIISGSHCLDGAPDGSDLPLRGRLEAMLDRRWVFLPGADLAEHLYAKRQAADKSQKAVAKRKAAAISKTD